MEGIRRLNNHRFVTLVGVVVLSLFWYQIQVYLEQKQHKESLHLWLKNNDLDRYIDKINNAGVKSLQEFAELDVNRFLVSQFPSLHHNEYSKVHGKFTKYVQKMKSQLILYYWLEENSLERYFPTLINLGFESIEDIKDNMNEEILRKVANLDNRIAQVSKLKDAIETLKLSPDERRHNSSWIKYIFYIFLRLLSVIWWIVKTIAKSLGYLLVSGILIVYIRATIRRTNSVCQRHKISVLNYVLGNYLHPKNTKVLWQWKEPAVVGQAMTFVIEFYRYNCIAHPVDKNSGITVEILHKGSMIAYSCEYGGPTQNRQDSNKMKVTFTVRQAGEYTIAILLAHEHVKGSPFKKVFLPGPVESSKCIIVDRLSMLVVKKDTYSPLIVQMRDKYGNTCALTDVQCLGKFKVDITKIGSRRKVDPELFVDTTDSPVGNVLHIKIEEEGCYAGEVSYDGARIDNSALTILSLTIDEWTAVEKNIQKHCYNVWYESSLLVNNNPVNQHLTPSRRSASSAGINGINLTISSLDSSQYRVSNKKLYCYISPKHLSIKEYLIKIIPRKLHVFRVSPRTKLTLHPPTREFEHPTFTLDDGIQPPVSVMCKDRNVLVATFSRLVLMNIGGSENFKKKQEFFNQQLLSKHGSKYGCTELKIDRQNLLESSYAACKSLYFSDWLRLFSIRFQGEEGLDWGGVRREWIDLLSGILFGHEHKLFTRFKEEDAQALVHPNPKRPANLKLKYYEFAGRIVGKCMYESAVGAGRRQNIKAKFSRSFLAQLLGQRVTYKHFETDDKDFYRSKIKYIEENDPADLDLKFVEEEYIDGKLVENVALKPGGAQIPVTEENKLEYLNLLAQYRLVTSCQQEIESFLKGLNELIPDSLLSIFDENELELVMCGTGDISVTDMKANHIDLYRAGSWSKVIDWFWTIVSSFTQEELARLVQFITGSSQLPPGGFSELSPTLQISYFPATDALPTAHTCFNQLCLADYTSFEEMQRLLLIAITEGCEGFGFA
ncbi:apoptosis-resistant E3 ubiquitin protein ligase 1-like [Actinia tenebrosa]|uniref:HECT-type E3 ubiquitin transferase n=1 Tax=Actinia tenebrosa TaxID=6105 RepID=A0A6P8ISE6_ACTTE|nr:apoptosis-resistant E3 ubiquitin protein ligase 1-like [Actinia tenebrosa]